MSIRYLDEDDVLDVKQTECPPNHSMTGYGSRIPTSWMLLIKSSLDVGRRRPWRRVMVVQWSNAGSAYVKVGRERLWLGAFDPALWLSRQGR